MFEWMKTTVIGKRGLSVVELGRLIHINEMVHLDQFKYKCIFIVNHASEVFFTAIVYNCFFLLQYNVLFLYYNTMSFSLIIKKMINLHFVNFIFNDVTDSIWIDFTTFCKPFRPNQRTCSKHLFANQISLSSVLLFNNLFSVLLYRLPFD